MLFGDNKMIRLRKLALLLVALAASATQAQQPPVSALETVENGVQLLLDTVEQSRPYFVSDQRRYFNEVEQALDSIVDFDAVATVVMSRYGDLATAEQKTRFGNILKSTLTRFYGAALASYEGQELVFMPSNKPPANPRADTVVGMELRGGDSAPIRLQYQMFLNENDEWKLKNLSLAGINLGRQYYTQFAASMSRHDNDIDQVLNNWQ